MILPRPNDYYPMTGEHDGHVARIVAVETYGMPSWEDPTVPPILHVRCSCGQRFETALVEAVGDVASAA